MSCRARHIIWVVLALVSVPAGARHSGEYLRDVSTQLSTPHTNWAAPYAGGRPKVLFIVPGILAPREIVELNQRLPLDFQALLTEHSTSFAATDIYAAQVEGTSPSEKAAELRQKLQQPYDAVVLGNVSLEILPLEFQYQILRRVTEGMGLVIAHPRPYRYPLTRRPLDTDRDFLTTGFPWRGLPAFQGLVSQNLKVAKPTDLPAKVIQTYQMGKGRLAILDYGAAYGTAYGGYALTPTVPASPAFYTEYDYHCLLPLKALLWVCPGKLPVVRLTFPEEGRTVARADLSQPLSIGIRSLLERTMPVTAQVHFRDTRGQDFTRTHQFLMQPGDNSLRVHMPSLPAGDWFMDAIVSGSRGVEGFGACSFVVTAPVELTAFTPAQPSVELNQTQTFTATLSAPAPREAGLRVELLDTAGRLFARTLVPLLAGQSEAKATLPVQATRTIAVRARASLIVGKEVLSRRESIFYVPRRTSEELTSILWGTNDQGLWQSQWDLMRRVGFNCFLNHPTADNFQRHALSDYRPFVYAYRICGGANEKGWRQSGFGARVGDDSFSNPVYRDAAKAELLERIAACPPVGPIVYSLGDENEIDYRAGYSPSDEVGLRQWLQKQYPDLAALNRTWGTSHASWDDLKPPDRAAAIQAGQYARVYDHYAFLEWQYAEFHHAMRDWIRELDPGAAVGAEGSMPGDLELSMAGLEMWSPYSWPRSDELLASLASPTAICGNWWGGYVGSHGGRTDTPLLWEHLLRGLNSSSWFAVLGSEGLLQAGGGFAPYFQRLRPQFEEIHSGLGQQIVAASPTDDGLALHWSQASEHAAEWVNAFGKPESGQSAVIRAARELGLNPRYVTTRGIEQRRELTSRPPRMLLLLGSQAISDQEAAAFTEYVRQGGRLVVETHCGVLGGRCEPRATNVLGELLGVTSDVRAQPVKLPGSLQVKLNGGDLRLPTGEVRVDPSVRPGTAQVLAARGEVPLLTVNALGKGQAILMNFHLNDALAGAAPAATGVDFLRSLWAACGVAADYPVSPRGLWEVRVFDNGATRLLGLLRRAPGAATLNLGRPVHVVDARAGRALGRLTRLVLPATEKRAVLIYTLLPEKPGALILKATGGPRGGTAQVNLTLPGHYPGATRVVRLRVTNPAGQEQWAHRRYLHLRQRTGGCPLPLAYNDPTGQWTVTATDITSGATARSQFSVTGG